MATSPEFEGKIMASAADLCGLCEDHITVKHCAVCPVNLCATCTKAHKKLPATRDHQLTDCIRGGAAASSAKPATKTGACSKHGDKLFTIMCNDCVKLGCEACKTDHKGHKVKLLDNDPKLCHRVINKNIQHLLDDVLELDEIKSVLEGQISSYGDAIARVNQWEIDLLALVKQKAAKIKNQLNHLKDEKHKQLSDQVNGLMTKLKEVDQSIVKLTAVRTSTDFTILTNEVAFSQHIITKLESYKAELKPLPLPITVDDLLPHSDKLGDVDKDLNHIFTAGDICTGTKGPVPVAEWCFTAANGGRDLSKHGKNHVTLTNVMFGTGPGGQGQGAAVIPTEGNGSICLMNPDSKLKFSTGMTFFAHVFLEGYSGGQLFVYARGDGTSGTHVGIHHNNKSLQISSDSSFDTTSILKPKAWNKIAVVFGPTVSVYVNGTLAHTENRQLDLIHTHRGDIHFGCKPGISSVSGRLESCKFFNVTLNESEIKNL